MIFFNKKLLVSMSKNILIVFSHDNNEMGKSLGIIY